MQEKIDPHYDVRQVLKSDVLCLKQVIKLEKSIFPKHESLAQDFHEHLGKHARLFAIILHEDVCGYGIARFTKAKGYIDKLAIREESRRKGMGKAILTEMIQWLHSLNVESISLCVLETREYARKLYEKCGFQAKRTRKNYYKSGKHAIQMILE